MAGEAWARTEGRPWLARARDLSGDGGVRKEELRPGSGQAVPPAASVAVKYSGYLEHCDEPFCMNCYSKSPRLMKLGKDITLLGLEIGLLTMKKGEVARFVFKPDYAYGRQGCPPLIPPNATVMFEVEVLDFLDSEESDAFFELTHEQQDTFPLQKVLKVANIERQFGNYLYRKQHFESARDRYKRAFSILSRSPSSEEEQCQINASKLLVLLNLSLAYLKLERPARALAYGEKALEIDQRNAKALFRCGQACLCMTEYKKARDFLVRAQHLQPFNHDINNELKKLARTTRNLKAVLAAGLKVRSKLPLFILIYPWVRSYQIACGYRDYMEKEKEMCGRMFACLNSSSC